ncbi:iron-containing redox enzyme family protein [Legionella shakespearei]|uniref:Iron-containing redox enzyme family protein n=1 Tax=Legionella shakespearei DSM 23087 TaxID=1122169 RepID=A0A0W0YK12_9GAMM|nr:iron-containing redox enzyme family protein [Legionella shakespearei]KTD57221.1 hypothetical protein Lsha_2603 [Legionella shakespearei DSM 23087]
MTDEKKHSQATQKLDAMCHSMAQDLSVHFVDSGMDEYRRFLNMMFHYTLKSGDRLKFAAEKALHPKLKQVFSELAEEEQYHYRLAQADLQNMGTEPSDDSPPEPVAFHEYWMGITPDDQFEYVGAMYVLENIASHIKPYLMPHFARLALQPGQSRFIMTHLVADEDHGQRLKELSDEAQGNDVEQVIRGGEKARKFWLDIHVATLV